MLSPALCLLVLSLATLPSSSSPIFVGIIVPSPGLITRFGVAAPLSGDRMRWLRGELIRLRGSTRRGVLNTDIGEGAMGLELEPFRSGDEE